MQEPARPNDILEELDWALGEVATLQSEGELEMARGLLAEVVEGELYAGLLASKPEVARFGLVKIADLARTLSLLEIQGRVRQEHYDRLSASRPPDDLELLLEAVRLGNVRNELGDLAGALELQEQSHEALVRLLSSEHRHVLDAKQNLAETRRALGNLEGALELEEFVHAVRERTLPADNAELLAAKLNMGGTRYELGDLTGAQELFEHVHAAWERLLPADHAYLLLAKQALALTRGDLGDLAGALELKEHVHASYERLRPPNHRDLLIAKSNLAISRAELGDHTGARELREEVHTGWAERVHADHPELLRAKQNLAASYHELGDFEGALELEEHVHAARERILPDDHQDLLRAKNNLACIREVMGDLEGALELLEQVHEAWERLLPEDHPDLQQSKAGLANVRRSLGDLDGAHELVRSLLVGQLALAARLRIDPLRVARATAHVELRRLSIALYLAELTASSSASAEEPLDALLFSVLESFRLVSTSSSEVALAVSRLPELEESSARLGMVRAELNDLSLSPPVGPSVASGEDSELEAWRKRVVELANERDQLERELRFQLREHGVFTRIPSTESVARGLERGAALVSYFRYPRRIDERLQTGDQRRVVDSLLAFILTPDAVVRRVELGPAAVIEDLAMEWRASLGSPLAQRGVSIAGSAPDENEAEIGRELRGRLFDPCLVPFGENTPSTLHVILDDFLHMIPVDALPLVDGRRLGESIELRFEVSARRLVEPTRLALETGTLLALGGVDYDADEIGAVARLILTASPPTGDSYTRSSAPGRLQELPHALLEVEALGGIFAAVSDLEPIVLSGQDASKEALDELAPKARWLHVATHGWFAPEAFLSMHDAVGSPAALGAGLARAELAVRGFAPETLCGLALAGANHGANSQGKVPGILTAEELATFGLAGCELAVLSACETNVGIRRAGQGIQSLQGALHAAGVRTAITSLWNVDDAATRRLMELFYTALWNEELGKADALWNAKMALRDEGHPVRDWAGWVLSGNPD